MIEIKYNSDSIYNIDSFNRWRDEQFQYFGLPYYTIWDEESGQEDTAEITNWRIVNAPKDPRSYKSARKEKVNTAEVRLLAKKEEAQADWFKKFMK